MPLDIESTKIVTFTAEPTANFRSSNISHNGHLVSYVSFDNNGQRALFLHNVDNGQITKINAPPGASKLGTPIFSKNDAQLFFAANIDSINKTYLYRYDLALGTTELVSSDESGSIAISSVGGDRAFSMSANGQYLVFVAPDDRFSIGDNNSVADIYLKNLDTGRVSLVSSNNLGSQTNGASFAPHISNDGKLVMFQSTATNLNNLAKDGLDHLYVKDLSTGSVQLVDVDGQNKVIGVAPYPYPSAIFSGDGSKIVFNNADYSGAYVRDVANASLVSLRAYTGEYFHDAFPSAISDNGRYLTFESTSNDYGRFPDDPDDGYDDIYRLDFQSHIVQFLSPHVYRKPYPGSISMFSQSDDLQSLLIAVRTPSIFGGISEIYRGQTIQSFPTLFVSHLLGLQNNDGDDALYGSSVADQLIGGRGNDTYWINNASDLIVENTGAGDDLALSLIANFTLPPNVENLVLGIIITDRRLLPWDINGTGNEMDNRITGNEGANILKGMAGNDVIDGGGGKRGGGSDAIDGGPGFDTVLYPNVAYWAGGIKKVANDIQIQHGSVSDLLQNVERVQFSDKALSLPGDTHAAQAYRIYQAAFNRTPDSVGLGFWVKQIDNGAKLTDIAHGFMQSDEFKGLYGEHPANGAMVEKFYQNVLHRAPDAGGLAFWSDVLNSGRGTPEYVLAQFSESPENQAALTGVMDAGFTFTLYK